MMREFGHDQLETGYLSEDWKKQAGEAVHNLIDSPAWFRLQQLLHDERKRICGILKEKPSGKTAQDYAEASGALAQCDKFEKYFETIMREARESK